MRFTLSSTLPKAWLSNAAGGVKSNCTRKNTPRIFLYAIDFDQKLAKVAKVMMLIMGDGKTHVFRVSSLDRTNGKIIHIVLVILYVMAWFDIVMTNPPFAGEIRRPKC